MKHDSLLRLRETKYVSGDLEHVKLDGTFCGFASVYNEVDLGNDMIVPGAFTKSLESRGKSGIRMLFQHDPDQPIGVWDSIADSPHGLKVKGRLATPSPKAEEVLELMRAGAIDGLSIGFRTVRSRQDPVTNVRKILEADLWEISVVTFPMQESARIETVKGVEKFTNSRSATLMPTIREFERWLVRDAGLSRKQAQLVLTRGYHHAFGQRDAANGSQRLAQTIRSAARSFNR